MATFDLAIVGVGGMGSAIAAQASARGLSVLGLEQFSIPNTRGSSHGATRILRLGLHEGPTYVPLVLRAVELWHELGERIGTPLFHRCGGLDVGLPDSAIPRGAERACAKFNLPHEVLDAAETRRRFPALRPAEGMMSVYQPGSGFVLPELAISTQTNLALENGAEIRGFERLLGWEPQGSGFSLRTERGNYDAAQVVFSPGAWIGKLLAPHRVPVEAERTVLGWFAPRARGRDFQPDRLPIWIVDSPELGHFYGFPIHGVPGFKLGRLRGTPTPPVDPDLIRRKPGLEDEEDMRSFIREIFPNADGPVLAMETCFFENSPDRTPIIDALPDVPGAWVVGGFSGHGFKFSSAVGEIVADLVSGRTPPFDLSPFRLARFS